MIRGQRGSDIEGGRNSELNTASSRLCLRLRAVVAGLSILVVVPGVSLAKDFCISFPGLPNQIVGRGFTVPGKGQCKPFTGFYTPGGNAPVAGTGCTSTDGSVFSLTLTTSHPDPANQGIAGIDSISLALPGYSGQDYITAINNPSLSGTNPVTGAACSKVVIPALDPETAPPAGDPQNLAR